MRNHSESSIPCVNHVDSPLLYQPIPTPVYMPEFGISTDSGAHTLYKSFFVRDRHSIRLE